MSYKIVRFGSSQIMPPYNPAHTIGTGAARIDAVDAPRGGAFDTLGSEQATTGGREIAVRGIILGSDAEDLKSQYDALCACLGRREKLWRADDAGVMSWVWARLQQVDTTRDPNNTTWLDLSLRFYVYSPLWHGDHYGTWRFDDGYAFDDVDMFFDTGLYHALTNPAGTTINLPNAGTGIIRDFVMHFTPAESPITGLTIIKDRETFITWAGSVAVGASLIVNFGAMSIQNNGVDAYNGFAITTDHKIDDWARLNPGDNFFMIAREGGSAESIVAVEYDDGWI